MLWPLVYHLGLTMPPTIFFRNLFFEKGLDVLTHRFPHGVVYFSADRWFYSGVNFGGAVRQVPLNQPGIATLKNWIVVTFGDQEPQETDYIPGTAYRRIAWPLSTSGNLNATIDADAMTQSFVALKILLTKMQDIFETVEPGPLNLQAHGHKIRELLLLAAMEVEASWVAVLKANGYVGDRLTTNDYVKLLGPMLLDSYSLTLKSCPGFPTAAPFKGWNAQMPTKSLGWYDAYNQTKHNREECLHVATLERAVNAVQAAAIMFLAQFRNSHSTGDQRYSLLENVFHLVTDFSLYPTARYIPNCKEGTKAWEWEMLDYPFPPA